MNTTITYLGDMVNNFPSTPPTAGAHCLVWAIDIAGIERRREAKCQLRSAATRALEASRACGDLKHLVIPYRAASAHRRFLHFTAQSNARRLHSELERAHGRYVDVVLIDLSEIDDNHLLTQRVDELACTGRGIVGYAAISWEVLRSESIREACTRDVI